jgi:hypothetical protein
MTWWGTDLGGKAGGFHPKMKSRFIVEFGGKGRLLAISSCTKPTVSIEPKTYRMINHHYSYPGIAKWEPISLTFVDGGTFAFSDDRMTSTIFWDTLTRSGYTPPNIEINASTSGQYSPSKNGMTANAFEGDVIRIHQLKPEGMLNNRLQSSETWHLFNPIITKMSWGDLSYGDDALVEYQMDITYDWAQMFNDNKIVANTPVPNQTN